ncbi:hypothetical protein Y1Q_0007717 [Alligator mississippiensis]|uniref:Uncharacterized protein n=1 Tax=Alligator mississippiensis TaxID=8496 RepID=A0A151NVK8_ALLMI|nr:hypothetical protein Y1Q_0007717 [Alligator mississippiensis]
MCRDYLGSQRGFQPPAITSPNHEKSLGSPAFGAQQGRASRFSSAAARASSGPAVKRRLGSWQSCVDRGREAFGASATARPTGKAWELATGLQHDRLIHHAVLVEPGGTIVSDLPPASLS